MMHSARSPGHHPESLYRKPITVAGGLLTFSDRYKAADLTACQHERSGDVLAGMDMLLRDLVDNVISARYFLIPLVRGRNSPSFHHAVHDPARITKEMRPCLAIDGDMPALQLVAAVPNRIKLGATDDIEKILGPALSG